MSGQAAPFSTVLVANRGEIAVRVITTLARLGIRSVAIFTPPDGGARHTRVADLALPVVSYLDADAVVAAAVAAGAEAIHPGYGFLSESPLLAQACAAAGIVWVGPDVRALELMGDKIASKAHVATLGVPVVPGLTETRTPTSPPAPTPSPSRELRSVSAAITNATPWSAEDVEAQVGYPLIVKPSAGGGGKGMQIVRSADELPAALAAARRVAAAAFGDDTLLLERLVTSPRHIEAQVIGDRRGRVEFLGLRECSLQRRHQKVIEEAPAPYPPGAPLGASRDALGDAAVAIARSVDYVGAGTVEFLVSGDDPDSWYFLEMNTRLQVEHPVTEAVTGLDIVEAQLRVAAGEPLSLPPLQEQGHAIEARIYAERPERGFVPSTGTLLVVHEPDGVRVDSGVLPGQTVSADYDPMIMKVTAHAPTRAEAIAALDVALANTVIAGVHTNVAYLRAVLQAPDVLSGTADTRFLDAFEPPPLPAPPPDLLEAAAAALTDSRFADSRFADGRGGGALWASRSGWRLGDHAAPSIRLLSEGDEVSVETNVVTPSSSANVVIEGDMAWAWRDGTTWELRRLSRADIVERSRRERSTAAADPQLRSPMPGTIVTTPVGDGAEVAEGDVVAVVEAMKMENPVVAPVAGVLELRVRAGQSVAADDVIAVVHPA